MRYLYYITAIILAATLAMFSLVRRDAEPDEQDVALTINDRHFRAEELAERQQHSPYHARSEQEFIEELITRELLIQEARRIGIDQEEDFRRSIQDYFEQSLIKVLMDRQLAGENVSVSLEEIGAYQRALGFSMKLRLQHYADPGSSGGGKPIGEEFFTAPFAEFPVSIQLRVMTLSPESSTAPFPIKEGYGVLRLLERVRLADPPPPPDSEEIVRLLMAAKRQQHFDQWLAKLRKKADIKVRETAAVKGGQHG